MSTINHDTAARLLGITPGELESLVKDGEIRRNGRDAYLLPVLVGDYCKHLRELPALIERGPKQSEIAAHLDISERSVREMLQEQGLDHKESTLSDIRVAYIRHLREIAAGRGGEQVGELAAERAALAREQRIKIAMQNAVTRGDLAPKRLLSDVLARTLARIARLLDTIPGELRRRCEALAADDIEEVRRIIAKVRNIAASTTLDDLDKADDEGDAVVAEQDQDVLESAE